MIERLYRFFITLLVVPIIMMVLTFIAMIVLCLPIIVLINPCIAQPKKDLWDMDIFEKFKMDEEE